MHLGCAIIAALMLWVLIYVTVEGMQRYMYDDTVSYLVWRTLGVAIVLGSMLALMPLDWASLMEWHALFLHPLAWVLAFRFVFFLPTGPAIVSGVGCSLIYGALTTMTFFSITGVGAQ